MAVLMKGSEVAAGMRAGLQAELEELRRLGVEPRLDVVRVGARPDDLAYERGALKRFEGLGIAARVHALPEDISQAAFDAEFARINDDPSARGVLLLRPLPG